MHRFHSPIESLESRRLMSASAMVVDGILQIAGTDHKDAISITLSKADAATLDVRVNAEKFQFTISELTGVTIDAMSGNDRIDVNEKNGPIYLNVVVTGGDGNDTITTGSGNDVIDAGAGNDSVTGGAGDDQITGGDGNDKLAGGDDNDMIDAGEGRDRLQGGDGDDNLDGGGAKDTIQAGAGDNSIATDAANPAEVHGKPQGTNSRYQVTSVADIPAQLVTVAETAVPGARVTRVEKADANYAIYYRFGTDPGVYKAVVEILDNGDVELVGRDLSLQEARPSAVAAFNTDVPNAGVLAIFQATKGRFNIRYRDLEGAIQTAETTDIDWGLDDASDDADNDGRYDPHQGDFQGGDNGNGQQNDPNPPGGNNAPQDGIPQQTGPQDGQMQI